MLKYITAISILDLTTAIYRIKFCSLLSWMQKVLCLEGHHANEPCGSRTTKNRVWNRPLKVKQSNLFNCRQLGQVSQGHAHLRFENLQRQRPCNFSVKTVLVLHPSLFDFFTFISSWRFCFGVFLVILGFVWFFVCFALKFWGILVILVTNFLILFW